jgi:hypothetical protein
VSDTKKDKKNVLPKGGEKSGEMVAVKDEKASGLALYKDASATPDGLDITPVSSQGQDGILESQQGKDGEDDIQFNGPVTCKLCNL